MASKYSSFLIRYWAAPDGARRISIEHVQSGERVFVASLAAASAQLARWAEPLAQPDQQDPPAIGKEGTPSRE